MARIFLCYASEDKPQVEEVRQRLQKLDFQPWMDKYDLLPGQWWQDEIPRALKASDFILIFFSKKAYTERSAGGGCGSTRHLSDRSLILPMMIEIKRRNRCAW
jgi:TIR domain